MFLIVRDKKVKVETLMSYGTSQVKVTATLNSDSTIKLCLLSVYQLCGVLRSNN